MGKSNALRKREKQVREGRRDPENGRSPFAKFDLQTRKTKNKEDIIYKNKHKNRDPRHWEDDSCLIM